MNRGIYKHQNPKRHLADSQDFAQAPKTTIVKVGPRLCKNLVQLGSTYSRLDVKTFSWHVHLAYQDSNSTKNTLLRRTTIEVAAERHVVWIPALAPGLLFALVHIGFTLVHFSTATLDAKSCHVLPAHSTDSRFSFDRSAWSWQPATQKLCEILFFASRSDFEWRPRRKGGQVLFNLSHSDYEAGHVSYAAWNTHCEGFVMRWEASAPMCWMCFVLACFVPREVQVVAQVAEDRGWRVVKCEEKASGVAWCSML